MLASAVPLHSEGGFAHEIKWDGYRALAYVEGGRACLVSRGGRDLSGHCPELLQVLCRLPHQPLLLDGELIALSSRGVPDFSALRRTALQPRTLAYAAFDLLYFEGVDICPLPWYRRRRRLAALAAARGPVFVSPLFRGPLPKLISRARRLGLEGIVSKCITAPYSPGTRSNAWRKIRVLKRDDFVIGGLRLRRGRIQSILVGQYNVADGSLVCLGGVGSGLSEREREFLQQALARLAGPCPFVNLPQEKEAVWLEPRLVAEVQYAEMTAEPRLRQPVFVRFRWDKEPRACVFEGG